MINFDDFKKIDIRVGEILSAERVPETDRLLRLEVLFNKNGELSEGSDNEEKKVKQVVSGIAEYFPEHQTLVGKLCAFVVNLEPRTIKGLKSEAMILAVSDGDKFSLLVPSDKVESGSRVS